MTTQPDEPLNYMNYKDYDGWVLPDYDSPEFRATYMDGLDRLKAFTEKATFEYGNSIYGAYEHFYKKNHLNTFKSACIDTCLNISNLETKNLTQVEKNCVK